MRQVVFHARMGVDRWRPCCQHTTKDKGCQGPDGWPLSLANPRSKIYNGYKRRICRKGRVKVVIEVREDETQEYPDWTGTLDEFLQSGMARGINKTTVRALKFLRTGCTLELDQGATETLYVTRIE